MILKEKLNKDFYLWAILAIIAAYFLTFSQHGMQLKDITKGNEIWDKVRIIAIKKDNEVLIPRGDDIIQTGDKLYIIGKSNIFQYY